MEGRFWVCMVIFCHWVGNRLGRSGSTALDIVSRTVNVVGWLFQEQLLTFANKKGHLSDQPHIVQLDARNCQPSVMWWSLQQYSVAHSVEMCSQLVLLLFCGSYLAIRYEIVRGYHTFLLISSWTVIIPHMVDWVCWVRKAGIYISSSDSEC